MLIHRTALAADRHADAIAELRRTCIGCAGCQGPCQALLDVALLPEAVLSPRVAS